MTEAVKRLVTAAKIVVNFMEMREVLGGFVS